VKHTRNLMNIRNSANVEFVLNHFNIGKNYLGRTKHCLKKEPSRTSMYTKTKNVIDKKLTKNVHFYLTRLTWPMKQSYHKQSMPIKEFHSKLSVLLTLLLKFANLREANARSQSFDCCILQHWLCM
jgi:hypothetical protein